MNDGPPRTGAAPAFDFFAAVQAPFRMQPGLRRLSPGARQLHANARGSRHLREKLQALCSPAPPALQLAAGFDPLPGLHALARLAAIEHPAAFAWDGRSTTAHELGWSVRDGDVWPCSGDALAEVGDCLAALPRAWRLAALLSLACAEDFAQLEAHDARIPWLAVALPSHWQPEQKAGLHFAQVHAPVADNAVLLAAGAALARLVAAPPPWERFVWTITPQSALNAHPRLSPTPAWRGADADDIAAQAFWRTERQTFIPVPDAGVAVFTILVDVQPLAAAIDSAARAARLHEAIASMSPAVLDYRGLAPVRDALLAWLAARR